MVPAITRRSLNTSTKITLCRLTLTHRKSNSRLPTRIARFQWPPAGPGTALFFGESIGLFGPSSGENTRLLSAVRRPCSTTSVRYPEVYRAGNPTDAHFSDPPRLVRAHRTHRDRVASCTDAAATDGEGVRRRCHRRARPASGAAARRGRTRRQRAGALRRDAPRWSGASGPTRCDAELFDPDAAAPARWPATRWCAIWPPTSRPRPAWPGPAPGRRTTGSGPRGRATSSRRCWPQGAARYVQESIALLYRDGGRPWLDESSPIDPVANLRSAATAEANAARVTAAGADRRGPAVRHLLRPRQRLHPRHDQAGPTAHRPGGRTRTGTCRRSPPTTPPPPWWRRSVAPAGLYNVGDDEPVTRREFFAALAGALGCAPPFIAPAGLAKLGGPRAAAVLRGPSASPTAPSSTPRAGRPSHRSVRDGWPVVVLPTVARHRPRT